MESDPDQVSEPVQCNTPNRSAGGGKPSELEHTPPDTDPTHPGRERRRRSHLVRTLLEVSCCATSEHLVASSTTSASELIRSDSGNRLASASCSSAFSSSRSAGNGQPSSQNMKLLFHVENKDTVRSGVRFLYTPVSAQKQGYRQVGYQSIIPRSRGSEF